MFNEMVDVLPTVLYSTMIGMVLIAVFQTSTNAKQSSSKWLLGLLLLLLIHLFGELFIYSGAYVYAPWLAGSQLPFRMLLGPALYFYAHSAMSLDTRISKKWWLSAFSGFVLVLLVMLPFIFMSTPAEKLALADPATRDPELWGIAVFTCFTATVLFVLFTAAFLFMTFKLHQFHRRQLMERFAEIEVNAMDWLQPVLLFWGIVWSMYAIEFALSTLGWRWFGSGVLLPVFETIGLAMFIYRANSQKELKRNERFDTTDTPVRNALLSPEKMNKVAAKLELAMSQDKLFLQDDLSLHNLSKAISETENHISETLSQYLHTNFFQFVNGFRVEAAKQGLRDRSKQITAIAYDVGFNSKSTFNTAFKKMVGHSPSAYRKLLEEDERNLAKTSTHPL